MEDACKGAGYESFEETVEDSLRQGGSPSVRTPPGLKHWLCLVKNVT